jgi:tetrapyrrole methylase family protein/MazG family protein
LPRTLTIAGRPGPESVTDPSGVFGPAVAAWLTPRPSNVSLPAPLDQARIDSAIQSVMTLLESRDLIYVGPGYPPLDDPLAAPLRDAALQANLEVADEPALPFWLGAIDAAAGFSVRNPADIPHADLSLPLVISALMSAPAVIDSATAVLARSNDVPLTLIAGSGETLHFDPNNLSSLELPANCAPFALVAGPVPPLQDTAALQSLLWVVQRLRASDGCPWDRRQTHRSLQRYLPEEAYEAVAAIEEDDPAHLAEELGDVLLQIALHSQIATEAGEFAFTDVIAGITRKMIHRHPHIFGDVQVDGVDDVLRNWEDIKAAERDNGDSLTAGVSASLPALTYAREVLRRAARSGTELPPSNPDGLNNHADKALKKAIGDGLEETIGDGVLGDMLVQLVELANRNGLDPEFALRQATSRRLNNQAES